MTIAIPFPIILPNVVAKPTFDQVYKETFKFVWNIIKNHGVHESAIDDLVQEVFIAVHRQLPTFEGKCAIKTWVYSIAYNYISNYRRTKKRKGMGRAINSDVMDPNDLIDTGLNQFGIYKQAEAKKILNSLISQMDKEKAEVFVLHELEEMSSSEISEITKINENTVYSRIRSGRMQFQLLLDEFNCT